jgi:hypothetical protein
MAIIPCFLQYYCAGDTVDRPWHLCPLWKPARPRAGLSGTHAGYHPGLSKWSLRPSSISSSCRQTVSGSVQWELQTRSPCWSPFWARPLCRGTPRGDARAGVALGCCCPLHWWLLSSPPGRVVWRRVGLLRSHPRQGRLSAPPATRARWCCSRGVALFAIRVRLCSVNPSKPGRVQGGGLQRADFGGSAKYGPTRLLAENAEPSAMLSRASRSSTHSRCPRGGLTPRPPFASRPPPSIALDEMS